LRFLHFFMEESLGLPTMTRETPVSRFKPAAIPSAARAL
jgi:hypothetical protein